MYRLKRENATSTDGKSTVQADKDRFKINIDGKSTQATRSGKNLYSSVLNSSSNVTINNLDLIFDFSKNINSYARLTFKKEVGKTYTFVFDGSGMADGESVTFYLEQSTQTFNFKNGKNVWTQSAINENSYFTLDDRDRSNISSSITLSNIMILEGEYTEETIPEYEQYGASSSPEFPSEIKSIGDDINLFDKDTPSRIDKEVVWKATETGGIYSTSAGWKAIRWNFELDTNSYYTFSYGKRNSDKLYLYIRTYTDNTFTTVKTIIVSDGTKLINTFKPDSKYVSILFQGSVSINNIEIPDIKLQKGNQLTSYSKYGEGTLNIEQSSKNLLRMNFKPGYEYTTNGIIFKVNDDYSVTINGTATNTAFFNLNFAPGYVINVQPNDKYTIYSGNTNKALSMTFRNVSPNVTIVNTGFGNEIATSSVEITSGGTAFAYIAVQAGKTVTNEVVYPMVLKGEYTLDTIGDYQPYFNKTYTLPLSEPLRSLPNGTKDTIEEDGIHRRVGRIVLDGSEDWRIRTDFSYENYTVFRNASYNRATYELITNGYGLSNYFNIMQSQVEENHIRFLNTYAYGTQITISNDIASTVEELKSWLSTHNTEVLYELLEEVVEPFTDEQKEIINSMVTEKGTNIFNINEDTEITLNYTPEFTDEIKHAFKYGITRGYLEVLDGSGLIINEDNYLQSIDFDDERYVDGEGIIGTTVAKSLEGKFINVDSEFSVENKELQAYIGAELDNGTTKYIDLGTFIVQKPDNNNVTDNTSFSALDYMVKFNKIYVDNITYPCTLGELLQNVCDQVNVILKTKTFRNSTFEIENNPFINNESCREVIKAIAQMAFSWARINQDNELVLDFNLSDKITETINNDEYYELKDNEQYGPVNTIILRNSQVEGENYTIIDPNKLSTDKTCELVINDNPFAYTQAKRQELIQAGSALFGFKYIPLTTKTIGSVYLNCQDKLRVKNMQDKDLDTYIFNNKISYDGRITDTKETSAMTETETKYQFTDTMANKLNAKMARTEIVVDKANQQITAVVEQIGDRSEKTTTITADIDGLNSKVSQIEDITDEKNGVQSVILENCAEGELLELHIYGNNTVFKYNTLGDSSILGDNLILGNKTSSTIIVQNEKGEKANYNLNIPGVLRQNGTTKDEYIIQNGKATIIRRINTDGSIKSVPTTEQLGEISIKLSSGNNTVSIKDFSAEMKIKYVIKTDLTDMFATRVELSSSIQQTSSQIMTQVNKKVGEEELGTKIIQDYESVQIAWNKIDELIQFINGKLKILNQNKETLMTLDKTGQHFFEGEEEFGNMGINVVDNNKYISFSVNGEYGQTVENGMAWGITTKSDNKFFPIFFIKNFDIAPEASDNYYGQLVLTACDLVLQGINTGIISGNMKMLGGDIGGELNFIDTNTDSILLQIVPENYQLGTSESINMLNNAIKFYKNQAGSSSFKIGTSDSNYCLFTDQGDIHTAGGFVMLGTSDYKTDVSIYPNSTVNIWNGNLNVDGNIYADNISSDERLKNNIQDSETNATENLNKFKIKSFDWKKDDSHIKTGFIAQQLEEIDEDYVLKKPEYNEKKEIKDYRYYINELPILATLVKGFQEQQQVIESLNNTIEEMKKEINNLKREAMNNG